MLALSAPMLLLAASLQQNEIEGFDISSLIYPIGLLFAVAVAASVVVCRRLSQPPPQPQRLPLRPARDNLEPEI